MVGFGGNDWLESGGNGRNVAGLGGGLGSDPARIIGLPSPSGRSGQFAELFYISAG